MASAPQIGVFLWVKCSSTSIQAYERVTTMLVSLRGQERLDSRKKNTLLARQSEIQLLREISVQKKSLAILESGLLCQSHIGSFLKAGSKVDSRTQTGKWYHISQPLTV